MNSNLTRTNWSIAVISEKEVLFKKTPTIFCEINPVTCGTKADLEGVTDQVLGYP